MNETIHWVVQTEYDKTVRARLKCQREHEEISERLQQLEKQEAELKAWLMENGGLLNWDGNPIIEKVA